MVFYGNWDSFTKAAADICAGSPDKARYTVKYRNCDGMLVLKVTDDVTCAQMRTERLGDIKKITKLYRILAQSTSHCTKDIRELPPVFPETKKDEPAAKKAKSDPSNSVAEKQQQQQQQKSAGRGKKTRGRRRK
ncbi:hypothetical protein IW140_001747 [Coemansia sp. RSA 1813]|nr:hypothetical protein EV178_001541 [Coemansia sp. RSA 1646]KAJ1772477.1 hypothetical protein LPJ74_001377 [Coemansia sp. RSA 1843]KAJ2090881.1 hypothetical protein IW138_002284 [Coemansia sp. RSA 986]KAJ2213174.1 hypothetical protein EV179_004049 [Coemansia sp. RSA 487]KAJ2571292.1 hypothetical protein IW140_001747 [Coemansia sp. RSA 1813]